jgi:hypothetical protein
MDCEEAPGYRYRLEVSTRLNNSKRLVVIQLNPSTANGKKSDPTIGKVSLWAKENGFGKVAFLNLFAYRSPDPDALAGLEYDILVGPKNDHFTRITLAPKEVTVVCAWGRVGRAIESHCSQRLGFLLRLMGRRAVYSVGELVRGQFPRHGRGWNGNNRLLKNFAYSDDGDAG